MKILLMVLFSLACFFLTACQTEDDSELPWGQPSKHEGTVPGMGGFQRGD